MARRDPDRLGRLETIGAWLRIWTPAREVQVPPVPYRKLLVLALGLCVVAGLVAALVVPAINSSKEETSRRERAQDDRRIAAERARLVREQSARFGRGATPAASPLAPPAERRYRERLKARVQRAITADARARLARGVRRTGCVPAPRSVPRQGAELTLARSVEAYDCTAVTSDIPRGAANPAGRIGYPFRAVVDFRRGSFAWCKTNPPAGERAVPDPRLVIALPRPCRLPG